MFLLPDVKLGIFVSTTGTIRADEEVDMSPFIATFVADMILNLSTSFDIAASCAFDPISAFVPPYTGEDIDFRCQDSQFKHFSGTFLHPVFDPVIVSFEEERQQLRFSFATFGQALLCHTNFDREKNALRFFFTDPTMVQLGYNTPRISLIANMTVTFRLDSNGKADVIEVHGFDSLYTEEFYRKDVYDKLPNSGSENHILNLSCKIFVFLIVCLLLL